ncbi:BRCT domain-containing protein At4g02110 [Andrographis paniculata]|uniref:BRCT domain-containing protein At4g02110 n=1 Tax=Andrographis paniculata TaxID=175694 RepID=UPI0021E7D0BA|nr:BRCT domain-containing protein At4g02110 [Andrographis paniculata]
MESKQILAYDDHPKAFGGVRFILFGFDSINEHEVRSKLLEGGGFGAVNYEDCSHVIVDKLVYDDPICVAARNDGKILVTGLWVDHSFDLGIPVDLPSVIYAPVKDLNGIPGANSLIMCLTGYQRHDREDIMTMVSLMGAKFSKPLVATKVTHLICYKFEGEKYELAKKMKIKLVNHRWLEDCLKAWQILPEADYCKSGFELEMESEAKDSEDETEDVASKTNMQRNSIISPRSKCAANKSSGESLAMLEASRKSLSLSASRNLANVRDFSMVHPNSGKDSDFGKTSLSVEDHNKGLEMAGVGNPRSPGKMPSEVLSNLGDDTVVLEKVGHVLASASGSVKKSPNNEVSKSSGKSYYRSPPIKSGLPLRIESNSGSPSSSNVSKRQISGGFNLSMERVQDRSDALVKTPIKGISSDVNDGTTASNKGKAPVSRGSSKSPLLNHEPKRSVGSKLAVKANEMLASGSSVYGSHCLPGDNSPKIVSCTIREEASCAAKEASNISAATRDIQKCNDHLPQHSPEGLKSLFTENVDVEEHSSSRIDIVANNVEMVRNDIEAIKRSSPGTNSDLGKMEDHADLNDSKMGQSDSRTKPGKRKMLAKKKTLGSRTTTFKAAKHKGTTNLQKAAMQDEGITDINGAIGMEDSGNNLVIDKVEKVPPAANEDCFPGDETEAPNQSLQNEYDGEHGKEISAEFEASPFGIDAIPSKSQADGKTLLMEEQVEKSVEDEDGKEAEKDVCIGGTELIKSNPTGDAGQKKSTKGKKRPLMKSKTKKSKDPGCEVQESELKHKQDENKAAVSGNEAAVSVKTGKTKMRARKKTKCADDVEKENKPLKEDKQKTLKNDAGACEELASEPHKNASKSVSKVNKHTAGDLQAAKNLENKSEPACFILSGHRLQRKDFQKLIKRLKGRVCRDSHNWSYQATHFVVPDPVRRTEKFFAAAASGSWILKTDYLTASSEAGRFLPEEQFEWHKKCLSEDGAINLEAPRKWRLLKKRTGHGAFYGMRIVIYGECIAPPLDTLKRVMKAGDGTILATSPPYTRFLKPGGIDFAVVSAGMPRVDVWVQEFLRHEVPCVVADYLVDYVCKPGYSLDKHVQYNTHAWAEKSLENLMICVEREEDVDTGGGAGHAKAPPRDGDIGTDEEDDGDDDDVACRACGRRDREEEMLICGDERGVEGCGVAVHIDCLDPPLDSVPADDWFCRSCGRNKG